MDVIPEFCGHGIGSYFHGAPDIFHFGASNLLKYVEYYKFVYVLPNKYYFHIFLTMLPLIFDIELFNYSRTPDERPPSPTTIPLIRPHIV